MTQVMRALAAAAPDVGIQVRTAAPARVFEPIAPQQIQHSEIDSGMVEASALAIDPQGSLEHLEQFMARPQSIISAETECASAMAPAMIVADIPFLAGDVAAAIGVPCMGISNFTWDWIYHSLFGAAARYAPLHQQIVASYSRFSALLQLPFGQTCAAIPQTIPMPLIAPRSRRNREQILLQIGIDASDPRPRVLFATRGGISPQALLTAALGTPEMLFLSAMELPANRPANLKNFDLATGLDFSDVLGVCDVVVSKLGYGIVAECIAARVRLLWPRRYGFAEDAITEQELPKYVPTMEIPHNDYLSGNWSAALRKLIAQPLPAETMRTDGAEQCASRIIASLPTPRRES
jgi:hypothetical protein